MCNDSLYHVMITHIHLFFHAAKVKQDIKLSLESRPPCYLNPVMGNTEKTTPEENTADSTLLTAETFGAKPPRLGRAPSVMHILAWRYIILVWCLCFCVFFLLQVRAWEQGRVRVCNEAKLPLIRQIEKGACAPEGNQPPVPPLLNPSPSALKSVPDEGFPVGIRCSCSMANQTRTKKKKKGHRLSY